MKRFRILVAGCCLLGAATSIRAEEWTDSTGKFTVQAELVDFDGQTAQLKRDADGKIATVPITNLSAANQQYLKSLGTPEDFRTITKLCAEIRRTWLDSPDVDTVWPGELIFHIGDPDAAKPDTLDWDAFVAAVRKFRGPEGPFAEVAPASAPARWQVEGPLALIRMQLARVRPRGTEDWLPFQVLLVAVRRQDKWRVAAGVQDAWHLDARDAFDPKREDHQTIRDCYAQIEQALENSDAELYGGVIHPEWRLFYAQDPDHPVVGNYDTFQEYRPKMLADRPVRESTYRLRYVRSVGPIALAIADAHTVQENGETEDHVSVDFLCRTGERWRTALSPAGDWRRILVKDWVPEGEADAGRGEPVGVDDQTAVRQLCDRARRAFADKDHKALLGTVWEDGFLALANNRTPWGLEQFAEAFRDFPSAPTGISLLEEAATIHIRGPIALIQLPAYQLKHPSGSEIVRALAIAARRDGQWRFTALLFGKWAFQADDQFDPNKAGHKQIQDFFDRFAETVEKKQADPHAHYHHPEYRLVSPKPKQPDSAVLISKEELLRKAAAAWEQTGSWQYRIQTHQLHTRQGVALVQTERQAEVDGKTRKFFLLFLLCRSGSDWQIAFAVTGDWREALRATADPDEAAPDKASSLSPRPVEPAWRESGDEEVTLQFKFTPGQTQVFRHTYAELVDGNEHVVDGTRFSILRVESVSERGVAAVRGSDRLDMLTGPGHRRLRGIAMSWSRYAISPTGRMENITGGETVSSLPSFPDHAVKLGDSWQAPVGFRVGLAVDDVFEPIDVTYTLSGLAQVDGNTWARIAFRGNGRFAARERPRKIMGVKTVMVADRTSQRLVVAKVVPDSAAAAAAILPGDVFVNMGESPLRTFGDLIYAVAVSPPDEAVSVVVVRGGERMELALTPRVSGSHPRLDEGSVEGELVFDVTRGKLIRRRIDRLQLRSEDPPAESNLLGTTTEYLNGTQMPFSADVLAVEKLVDKINLAWAAEDGRQLFEQLLSERAFLVPFVLPHLPDGVAVLNREDFLSFQARSRGGANFKEHTHRADSITVIGAMAYEFGTTTHVTMDDKTNAKQLLNCYALEQSGWKLVCSLPAEHVIKTVTAPLDVDAQGDNEAVAAVRKMAEKVSRVWQAEDGIEQLGECFSEKSFAWAVSDPKSQNALVLNKPILMEELRRQQSSQGGADVQFKPSQFAVFGPLVYATGSVKMSSVAAPTLQFNVLFVFAREAGGWKAICCISREHLELAIPSLGERSLRGELLREPDLNLSAVGPTEQ